MSRSIHTVCNGFILISLKNTITEAIPEFSLLAMFFIVAHASVSFLSCGQCILLGYELTEGFMIKAIVSAIVASAIYYCIGYMALKNKFDLQPHNAYVPNYYQYHQTQN